MPNALYEFSDQNPKIWNNKSETKIYYMITTGVINELSLFYISDKLVGLVQPKLKLKLSVYIIVK